MFGTYQLVKKFGLLKQGSISPLSDSTPSSEPFRSASAARFRNVTTWLGSIGLLTAIAGCDSTALNQSVSQPIATSVSVDEPTATTNRYDNLEFGDKFGDSDLPLYAQIASGQRQGPALFESKEIRDVLKRFESGASSTIFLKTHAISHAGDGQKKSTTHPSGRVKIRFTGLVDDLVSNDRPSIEGFSEPEKQTESEDQASTDAISLQSATPSEQPPLGSPTSTPAKIAPKRDVDSPGYRMAGGDGQSISNAANLETDPEKRTESALVLASEEEKNQKIAEDWANPWATLFITGQQHGYIEPCGCTGLENQKGGLNRRDTLLNQITARGWEVIPIDAGNQIRRVGTQAERKYLATAEALGMMDYEAVAFGPDDLKISVANHILSMTTSEGEPNNRFVSANVSIIEGLYPIPFKVLDVGTRRIGITSVLGEKESSENRDQGITVTNPIDALQSTIAELKNQKCDQIVVVTHASLEESRDIAKAVSDIDFVITAGGFGEPTFRPEAIDGTQSQMIQVGVKGMYVGLLGFFDDAETPVRYQRIALSDQFQDSTQMMKAFAKYQDGLRQLGLKGLGVREVTHHTGYKFVGSETCADCHTTAFSIWEETPHAHATDSIVHPPGREDISRHFDPECLSCHVTGWNPQEFFPYESGFVGLKETPAMQQNGCENCHGPGSQHVAAENGDIEADDATLAKFREEMRLPLSKARERCEECHDLDNSPAFYDDGAFEEYWDRVKHYGKD